MENKLNRVLLIGSFLVLTCIGVSGCGHPSQQQADPPAATPTEEDPAMSPARTLEPSWTATATRTPFPRATLIPGWGTSTSGPPLKLRGPIPGLFAPDLRLEDIISENQVNLSDYVGHPVLLFFWTTWCPHCATEVPILQAVYKKYRNDGFVVLAPDVGENAEKARSYRIARGLSFTMLNDSDGASATTYRVPGYPTHYFIAPSGRISSLWIGELNRTRLDATVKSLFSPSR